jgi:hypothetical protein
MLNAIITVNEMNDIGKRMKSTGNTKTYKPMISPNSTSPLNPYGVNAWLFKGLNNKNKN